MVCSINFGIVRTLFALEQDYLTRLFDEVRLSDHDVLTARASVRPFDRFDIR